jgi:hypothetical protein
VPASDKPQPAPPLAAPPPAAAPPAPGHSQSSVESILSRINGALHLGPPPATPEEGSKQ